MDNYIEITISSDPEFGPVILMNALYAKLHRVLGRLNIQGIGVSFPQHGKTLGSALRLHGDKAQLDELMTHDWFKGLTDYLDVGTVTRIPANSKYRCVRRIQRRSQLNKKKRAIAKGWLSPEEAALKFPDCEQRNLDEPYAEFRSLSTGSMMRVFIRHDEIQSVPVLGEFTSYGLSKSATVPWF